MGQPDFQLPGEEALQGLMNELTRALKDVPDNQQKMLSLSATAWSEDGLIKAEVGPRGQLVDLEIDPRVFRRPDSQALKDSILEAVNAAVRQVTEQANELVLGQVPPDIAELRAQFHPGGEDPMAPLWQTDAELMAERRRADDDLP